ncbi:PhzF family phenazine biosynthesis protein [Nonomuraea sp. NPDC050556]|uniref:PhzF family phenazine biosynthesis protein n=1 Tax=Nonomuraea sp. NPDC050556 TaxID=3364369 RepID=UPI003799E7A6
MPIEYHHVDVFADRPYTGNSLAVFVDPPPLSSTQMLTITQELRHFETIFVTETSVRVFDLVEELDFAGHPLLGAAAVLGRPSVTFTLRDGREVEVTVDGSQALLDQGRPSFIPSSPIVSEVAEAMGLHASDLLEPEVISTGLRYLVIPVRGGDALARAQITHPDLTSFLAGLGAQFAYLLDISAVEGRHWNNDGVLEDVATGSAAGCAAAYLLRHGHIAAGEKVSLSQGRFTGRPSTITITAYGTSDSVTRVTVGGNVAKVGTGTLSVAP